MNLLLPFFTAGCLLTVAVVKLINWKFPNLSGRRRWLVLGSMAIIIFAIMLVALVLTVAYMMRGAIINN